MNSTVFCNYYFTTLYIHHHLHQLVELLLVGMADKQLLNGSIIQVETVLKQLQREIQRWVMRGCGYLDEQHD